MPVTPYIIAIAGPGGSGKSVFCRLMQSQFANVSRLKFDDFFIDAADVNIVQGYPEWDHPNSIKWPGLIQAAKDLKEGKFAITPNYSRRYDRQIGEKCIFPAEIMLLDGFMSLANEVLLPYLDLKLYFNLSEDSQKKRRKIRQPSVEKGYLEHIMIPGHRKYLYPSMKNADYVINAELTPTCVAEHCIGIIQTELRKKEAKRLIKSSLKYKEYAGLIS